MIEIREVEWESDLGRAAGQLRVDVFVKEQGVPADIELDEYDAGAVHLVAVDGGHGDTEGTETARRDLEVVGTLRILEWGEQAKVGRVAVRRELRGLGIGRAPMYEAIRMAKADGYRDIVLSSQLAVVGFYERLGFVRYGGEFVEAGIPHVKMVLRVGDDDETRRHEEAK